MAEATDEFCFVYSTFPEMEAAKKCARLLVQSHLAACVNIHPPMASCYIWQGKLEESEEVTVFIKTRRTQVDAVIAASRPLHPYSTPCFLVLPIEAGNADYLSWARAQTDRRVTI